MMIYYVGFSGEIIIKGEFSSEIKNISSEAVVVHEIPKNLFHFVRVPSLDLFNSAEDLASLIVSDSDLYFSSEKDLIIVYPIGTSFSISFLLRLKSLLKNWRVIKAPGWITIRKAEEKVEIFISFFAKDLISIEEIFL